MPFGSYYWGFTLNCALSGLLYGLILYRNPNRKHSERNFILRIIISNVLVYGLINVLLTPLWLNRMYGQAYMVLLASRLSVQMVMLPVQMIVIYTLDFALRPFVKNYLYEKSED